MTEESLFHEALAKANTEERAAFLDTACAGRPGLRAAVEALLVAHAAAGHPLDRPVPVHPDVTSEHTPEPRQGLTEYYVPPDAEPGAIIAGRYTLVEKVGEGGMGEVWVAWQTEPVKRKVALKLVKPGMDSRLVVGRFEQERQALALMDHPSIARVLDGGLTADRRPFFVMELVNGLPLMKFCDQATLGIPERLELFVPICRAVQHAHQKGIIHRDLKPSNILVTLIDGKPVPRVIDFGVAKATGGKLTEESLSTQFGAVIGTLEYMAPEQAGFSGTDVDTRADVYSLGVILYELLTGLRPFDGKRMRKAAFDERIRMIREEEPPAPSTRLSTAESSPSLAAVRQTELGRLTKLLRGELDWVVMKCLEKQRDRRYETAGALAHDVQRYLADEPVEARPPCASYRLGKFLRRNRGPVLAAALVLLALVGGVIGAAFGWIKAQKQQEVTALWARAEKERDAAEDARDGEKKAKREAEDAREKLAVVEYGRTMQVAHQEWRENNVPATLALLDSTRPDLRGWEWRYVHRLCHSDVLTLGTRLCSVSSAAFSPDGTRVVTGGADETARVWDARTGAEMLAFKGHKTSVGPASFSPDGSRVVTGSYDLTAKVWDAKTGTEIFTLAGHTGAVYAASFSPDGARVVTGSEDHTARVWDAKTGALVRTIKGHAGGVRSASFSADGSRLVTGSEDGTAKVWDSRIWAEVLTLKGHFSGVYAASFNPDGSRLVTGSPDWTAKVWDARTGVELITLKGHTDRVYAASFSPDGARVVTGSWDRSARVWDAKTGEELLTLKGHTNIVLSASFSPDGSRVVTAAHNDLTARVWDAKRGLENLILRGHTDRAWSAAFSPDGRRVVTASWDGTAKVWEAKTGKEVRTFKGHADSVWSASFRADGLRIVTGSRDRTAKVWDARTGDEILTLKGHNGIVTSASYSPDGSRIVTGSYDKTARVWDARTGEELLVLGGHADVVHSASFSPDGSRVVTDGGPTPKVWDAKTGVELLTLQGHTVAVWSASFSPDGSRVVSGSYDRTAKVWDAKTGAELFTLQGHTDSVVSASFSPDGLRIITGGNDRTARLWDARTGAEVLTLKGHTDHVIVATFSPDGSRVVTVGLDGTARVWDTTPVNRDFLVKGLAPPRLALK
jgi:WD40 repeat protein/tRNA A-37 threonylcarbamoyl transferase component Bud32